MKIKTFEEILKNYKYITDHWADQDYDEDNIIEAMKAFASQLIMTDEEIEKEATLRFLGLAPMPYFIEGARWYREQIKESIN